MQISVINHSNGLISDNKIQIVLRAINRQIREDFFPYWSMDATLRLDGRTVNHPDSINTPDMRGDGVIYLWDQIDEKDAKGYHDRNFKGVPYTFVLVEEGKSDWTVTLSHEALEMIADPDVNLLVVGEHPKRKHPVYYWYEVCDAVQSDTYFVDGIKVSDFVLPFYFTPEEENTRRNDFLGVLHDGEAVRSFDVNPGRYMGFYDPELRKTDFIFGKHGEKVLKEKEKKGKLRRAYRYQSLFKTIKKKKPTKRRK